MYLYTSYSEYEYECVEPGMSRSSYLVVCVIVCDDDHRGYRIPVGSYQVLPVHDFTMFIRIGKDPPDCSSLVASQLRVGP